MDVNMFTLYIIELLLPLDTLNKSRTNKNKFIISYFYRESIRTGEPK
jgi:hypothetical protein